jgi:hypothetical protein
MVVDSAKHQDPATELLPARHPMLRDAAVFPPSSRPFAIRFQPGVAGFLGFVLKIVARLVHASN